MTVEITPIPAFNDNYLWLIVRDGHAVIVDPGDPGPVQRVLAERDLVLDAILVTHHHGDHVGGVNALRQSHRPQVFGPRGEDIAGLDQRLAEGDTVLVLDVAFEVLEVPGHTRGHIAYHAPELQALFCGDTLFGAGCGRLFEGTPAQMLDSLGKLARLPAHTRVYCAHEYTLSNLRFARAAEPGNEDIVHRQRQCEALRAEGRPTLPSTIGEELRTNPFLRCEVAALRAAADARRPGSGRTSVDTFAALREWKNSF